MADVTTVETGLDQTKEVRVTRKITDAEFTELQANKKPLTFNFPLVRVSQGEPFSSVASFSAHDSMVDISVDLEDGKHFTYPKNTVIQKPEKDSGQYTIDGKDRRFFQENERSAEEMSSSDFVNLLIKTPGEGIVFYTGAGISRGGEAPVWDMGLLNRKLHMEGIYNRDKEGALKTFIPAFIENPGELAQGFNQFNEQLYLDVSTPAHQAISNIVEAKPGATIITENVDIKHEAKGSRMTALHLDSTKESFEKVKKVAEKAQVLITVGLSIDDRAVIGYMKDKNPDLKIVAINLPVTTPTQLPTYLQEDVILTGDCQQILPQIAGQLQS